MIFKFFAIRHTFKVYERLKREQHIRALFLTGKAFSVFPVKFVFHLVASTDKSPVLTGFSIPKKKFKSSVDRHRVRRLMVESWRLNKYIVYPQVPTGKQIHLFLIYNGTTLPDFDLVKTSIVQGINLLTEKIKT